MAISTRGILEKRGNPEHGILKAANIERRKNESYSLRRILIGPFALKVQLKKIDCLDTEDTFGHDELALDIYIDSEFQKSLRFRLKEGQSHIFDRGVEFLAGTKIAMHLYDRDDIDADDLLGNHTIWANNLDGREKKSFRFNKDGAKYNLELEMSPEYLFPKTPQNLVDAFRIGRSTPVWSKITRKQVADDLDLRIMTPKEIHQGPTSFCGPAAVLFEMARHMPKRYVKMVIDLYERGSWESANGTIKAPQDLLNEEIYIKTYDDGNTSKTPAADWIALTSMRDSANWLFSLDEPDDVDSSIQAGALATEVAAWCPQLLGWRSTDIYTTTQFGLLGFKMPKLTILFDITGFLFDVISGDAIDGFKEAKKTLNQGGAAMLQINSDLLDHVIGDVDNPGDPSVWVRLLPNVSSHFVSLYDNTANISHSNRVTLKLYTWGRTENIEISEEGFEREMFAYVFTKPGAPI